MEHLPAAPAAVNLEGIQTAVLGDGHQPGGDGLTLQYPRQRLVGLHEAGLVHVRREGRQMLYGTNAEAIRPLYEWAGTFERFWRRQLKRIKERAEQKTDTNI